MMKKSEHISTYIVTDRDITERAITELDDVERAGLEVLRTMEDETSEGPLWDIQVEANEHNDKSGFAWLLFRGHKYGGYYTWNSMRNFLRELHNADGYRPSMIGTLINMLTRRYRPM